MTESLIDKAWEGYSKNELKDDGEHIVEYSFCSMEEAFRAGAAAVGIPTPDRGTCIVCDKPRTECSRQAPVNLEAAADAFNDYLRKNNARVAGLAGSIPSHALLLNALRAALNVSETPVDVLPYDVKIGAGTFKKGVKLSALVNAALRWHDAAGKAFRSEARVNLEPIARNIHEHLRSTQFPQWLSWDQLGECTLCMETARAAMGWSEIPDTVDSVKPKDASPSRSAGEPLGCPGGGHSPAPVMEDARKGAVGRDSDTDDSSAATPSSAHLDSEFSYGGETQLSRAAGESPLPGGSRLSSTTHQPEDAAVIAANVYMWLTGAVDTVAIQAALREYDRIRSYHQPEDSEIVELANEALRERERQAFEDAEYAKLMGLCRPSEQPEDSESGDLTFKLPDAAVHGIKRLDPDPAHFIKNPPSEQPDDCRAELEKMHRLYRDAINTLSKAQAELFKLRIEARHATERESISVDDLAEAIRTADNGLDGDPLCVLLDESPHIDSSTATRDEANDMILRVCRSVAAELLAAFDIRRKS